MTTIRVSRKLFSKYRSIQSAIQAATAGCVIEIEPGLYKEELWIDRYVELVGVGEGVVIQGMERPAVEMATGYAVIKNVTFTQGRRNNGAVILVNRGSLVVEGCDISAETAIGVSIVGDEAEPVFRRSKLHSEKNGAVFVQGKGRTIFEQCELSSQSNAAVVFIAEGNPHFHFCTITGNPCYGIFVEEKGSGIFEECNLYGFDQSPAIGIEGGNPFFLSCKIHDGKMSGLAIYRGQGLFRDCTFFGFAKESPAIRVSKRSYPRFQGCTIKSCAGGAFLFESGSSGLVENCELFGFTHRAAVTIRTEAHPHFLHSRIHDGDREGVHCYSGGKGMIDHCELSGFNQHIIAVNSGQLDLCDCKIYNGNEHGIYFSQNASGVVRGTSIYQLYKRAAIAVEKAANPLFVDCQVSDSLQAVRVAENGRGSFERCSFKEIHEETWEIANGYPKRYQCSEEGEGEAEMKIESEAETKSVIDGRNLG